MTESSALSTKVHHIGYVVSDLAKAIDVFQTLSYSIGKITNDNARNVAIVFANNGNENVELIAPLNDNSPVSTILNKNGPSPYHICYETNNIQDTILKLRKNRWLLVQKPAPAPAIDDRMVAFLYNKDIGLIELVEMS